MCSLELLGETRNPHAGFLSARGGAWETSCAAVKSRNHRATKKPKMTNNTDKQRPLGTWIPLCKTSQIVFFGFCFVVFLLFGFRLFGLIGSDFSLNSVILVLVCAYGSPVDRDNV